MKLPGRFLGIKILDGRQKEGEMTIDEAIELLLTEVSYNCLPEEEDLCNALKLGIDALKWRRSFINSPPLKYFDPLPGETKE